MENKQKGQSSQEQARPENQDQTNTRPNESQVPSDRLSAYPEGNTEECNQTQNIPGNQTDRPFTQGKTIAEATDPSKLSDI